MSQAAIDYIHQGRKEFFVSKCQAFPKATYQEALTHILCISGIEAPFGNAVWQLPHSFVNEHDVCKVLEIFKHNGLPFFWWEAPIPIESAEKEPKNMLMMKDLLIKNGLQAGGLLKGVCTRLAQVNSVIQVPNGVTIHQVQSLSDLKIFCQLVFAIHDVEPHTIEQIYLLSEKPLQTGEEAHYLAYQNDKPIGGITLATGKKVAGIWNFATLPSHRKQGIGSALIQAALNEAKQQGYQEAMAILMPSEMGALWRQFHFQEICYFPFYIAHGKGEHSSDVVSKRVRRKSLL